MDKSNWIHLGITIAVTTTLWWAPHVLAVALLAIGLFYMREMRDYQRERQSLGIGHRNKLMLRDLNPFMWHRQSQLDFFPSLIGGPLIVLLLEWSFG